MLSTLHAFRNNTRDFISCSQGKKIRSRTFSRFENACYSEEIPELIRTWGSHYSEEQKRKKWINYNPFLKARIKKANTSTETLLCWNPKGWTAFVMYTFCVCVCQWIQISSMSNDFSFLLDTCHPWSLMLLSFSFSLSLSISFDENIHNWDRKLAVQLQSSQKLELEQRECWK